MFRNILNRGQTYYGPAAGQGPTGAGGTIPADYATIGAADLPNDILGLPVRFKDVDWFGGKTIYVNGSAVTSSTPSNYHTVLGGEWIYGRIMRNVMTTGAAAAGTGSDGTGTVYGGQLVAHAAGARGRCFSALTAATAAVECAGIVDPTLSVGCRPGDICIVFTKGPCLVAFTVGTTNTTTQPTITFSCSEGAEVVTSGTTAGLAVVTDPATDPSVLNVIGRCKKTYTTATYPYLGPPYAPNGTTAGYGGAATGYQASSPTVGFVLIDLAIP